MTAGAGASDDLPVLEPGELAAAGRAVPSTFVLRLKLSHTATDLAQARGASGDVRLICREILRLLPRRRLVARVEVGGRTAVLKLFLGDGARRYFAREKRGCSCLAAAGVATPALLAELDGPEGGYPARGLLFENLADARPVSPAGDEGVAAAAAELARLHQAGFRYRDLHLDNFLECPDRSVYVVDGDGVRPAGRGGRRRSHPGSPLTDRSSLRELAVLCAQRPPLADERIATIYSAYAARRGWRPDDAERLAALDSGTRRERRARVRRFLTKAQRDCTEFHQHQTASRWVVAVREAWNPALAAFAEDPESAFEGARVVKAGNSATVVRARLGDHVRVIKRYNLKGPWHALRRALTPTPRYRLAWLNGQRLWFLQIPTARPLALVERRLGPLRGVAYLVMENLGDEDLAGVVDGAGLSEPPVAEVAALFRALARAELTHGDTKASNFLITDAGVHLVDLDAMAENGRRRHKDVDRFLANFDHVPDIRERFRRALAGDA